MFVSVGVMWLRDVIRSTSTVCWFCGVKALNSVMNGTTEKRKCTSESQSVTAAAVPFLLAALYLSLTHSLQRPPGDALNHPCRNCPSSPPESPPLTLLRCNDHGLAAHLKLRLLACQSNNNLKSGGLSTVCLRVSTCVCVFYVSTFALGSADVVHVHLWLAAHRDTTVLHRKPQLLTHRTWNDKQYFSFFLVPYRSHTVNRKFTDKHTHTHTLAWVGEVGGKLHSKQKRC